MKALTRWAIVTMPLSLLSLHHAHADPLEAQTTTKEAAYSSPFEGYVKDQDFEVGGWVAANEKVGEIGGWRTYLRQAQEPMNDSKPSSSDQEHMKHREHGSNGQSKHGAK